MSSKTRKDWVLPFVLLALIWGLIGLNRNTIGALGPFLRKEFGIDDLELATAAAIFAFTWALGSYFAGLLSARFGTKRIIVGAGILTSLFGWVASTVGAFFHLIAVRATLGLVEGSVMSPIFAAGRRVVPANMRATVISVFFASFILIGMAGGTALLAKIGQEYGWRIGFALAAAPLFVIVLCTAYFFKEPPLEDEPSSDAQTEVGMVEAAKAAFRVANVWVCSLVQVFNISRVFAILTFGVLFVIEKHGFEPAAAGGVVGLGLVGEVIGALSIGFIVDRVNKTKLPLVIIMFVSGMFAIIFALLPAGTPLPLLIGSVFICTLFGGGAGPLSIGVIPAESLPSRYSPSAIGMTNFFGEFVGGGLLLIAAGAIARALGYQTMFVCVGVALWLGMGVCFGLRETRR